MAGIDPENKELFEEMIKGSFQCGQINSTDKDINQEFYFDDGTAGYHLIISRQFLDDEKTLERLRERIQKLDLMNWLKNNPNKIVSLGTDGRISIAAKPN